VNSLLQEVTATAAFQLLHLEKYDDRVQEQNCIIKDIQQGNWELLQQNHHLEVQVKALIDKLMRTYRSLDVNSDFLDDART
jgi:hypothetical protein